jgi:hypothetical protein
VGCPLRNRRGDGRAVGADGGRFGTVEHSTAPEGMTLRRSNSPEVGGGFPSASGPEPLARCSPLWYRYIEWYKHWVESTRAVWRPQDNER